MPVLQPVYHPLLARHDSPERPFELFSKYAPAGDQPTAIAKLRDGIDVGLKDQILLGATGTGKTFTMANVIAHY
ncbi:MAG: DEAD/DEAH box helicase family protein, partial [Actinomycetia bacterium]|nr:DEAD/DEAH box helicase family protein [Actinomycetes bacterium]